jgi:hypothetical protein
MIKYMSDYINPFETKPIEKVKNDVHQINQTMNKIKTDMISIRADISIIKDYIKKKESEEISKGWFFS